MPAADPGAADPLAADLQSADPGAADPLAADPEAADPEAEISLRVKSSENGATDPRTLSIDDCDRVYRKKTALSDPSAKGQNTSCGSDAPKSAPLTRSL